jgi:Icc-related predicted phosphoesterase
LHMMFQEHQPKLWVFGHHHQSKDVQINGTRFVCLNELETMTLEL